MSANPHIRDNHSPLEQLVAQALRRYGEFGISAMDTDMAMLMLDLANDVVDEVNSHPYAPAAQVERYTHPSEAREIPDQIMVHGLLAKYSMQQGSPKAQLYAPQYMRLMNRELWHQLSGSGPIQLRVTDDGTGTARDSRKISPITGMPE